MHSIFNQNASLVGKLQGEYMVKILALKFEPKKSYDHISKFSLHNSTPHQPQIGIGKIKTKVCRYIRWADRQSKPARERC